MNKVSKKGTMIPAPLNNCEDKIREALTQKGKHKFSGYYYASTEIKDRLNKIYDSKCAFCESDTSAGASLQVEHYRPKAKVTEDASHEGYYWLGYEWTNLLYACSSCNSAKSTHFPLDTDGLRVYQPPMNGLDLDQPKCSALYSDLVNEKPLILNPEENNFNAEIHLIIGPNGRIRGRSKRGVETVECCKLDRPKLRLARKKIVDEHRRYFMRAFVRFKNNEIPIDNLKGRIESEIEKMIDRINDKKPYTLLAKNMLKNFDQFYVRQFEPSEQLILNEVFRTIFKR